MKYPPAMRTMTSAIRPLACLLAGLACGHALGQDAGQHEGLTLHGAAMRTIAERQTPLLEPRLSLYADTRPGLRLAGTTALPAHAPRIGLELSLAPSPTLGVARGTLLRTKLSEGTYLSLRLRRHSIGVVLRSEF